MTNVFEGQTADEVWQAIARRLRDGNPPPQASRAGSTRELLHTHFMLVNPRERWVHSRGSPINPAFAIAEVLWMLAGRQDSAFLNYFNRGLPKYAGLGPTYHGAYGHRLRHHFGFDQLEHAYLALQSNADSRQIVLQIWDPRIDLPKEEGKPVAADIPCNVMSLLKIRDGVLEWMQIVRSNDLFRGLPYNLVQFTTLQEVMAGWLGVHVGAYHQISDSLHLYLSDESEIQNTGSALRPINTDSLALSKAASDEAFRELTRYAEVVIREQTTADDLANLVQAARLPTPFQNMLCVLAAEGVRRRQREDMAGTLMHGCTNPVFHLLWTQWQERFTNAHTA